MFLRRHIRNQSPAGLGSRSIALGVLVAGAAACGSATPPRTAPSTPAVSAVRAAQTYSQRYCEVILVKSSTGGLVGDVYNSYPLNTCPENEWSKLDAKSIAAANGAIVALLNGPRYWLMDGITKQANGRDVVKNFGGIAMTEEAVVAIGSMSTTPYTPHAVDRQTIFTFGAGRTVYELVDPSARRWIMQTWSQIVDPHLEASDLAGLGPRLDLPPGWKYEVRVLKEPLAVVTTATKALVLQDPLQDSYSLETVAPQAKS